MNRSFTRCRTLQIATFVWMNQKAKKDILTRADIEQLVSAFYRKVLSDNLLAPAFAELDIDSHLPVMYDFWASLLLKEQGYTGNPFDKHLRLSLSKEMFEHWLFLFDQTVDAFFEGEKASLAKERAHSIAFIFQSKLESMGKLGEK
jgi:hemoglobin